MTGGIASLTPLQASNARAIVAVGKRLGFPEKGLVIALATAMQESNLGADPTSVKPNRDGDAGVFQQRVKPGWYGTLAQVNDINYAAKVFFVGKTLTADDVRGVASPAGRAGYTIPGLAQVKGWELMSVTAAAQAVQRSAFPLAYAKHESKAKQIVADLKGGSANTPTTPTDATIGGTTIPGIGTIPSITINWKSVAFVVLGIILILIALVKLTGIDDTIVSSANAVASTYTGGIVNVK